MCTQLLHTRGLLQPLRLGLTLNRATAVSELQVAGATKARRCRRRQRGAATSAAASSQAQQGMPWAVLQLLRSAKARCSSSDRPKPKQGRAPHHFGRPALLAQSTTPASRPQPRAQRSLPVQRLLLPSPSLARQLLRSVSNVGVVVIPGCTIAGCKLLKLVMPASMGPVAGRPCCLLPVSSILGRSNELAHQP